MRLTGKVILVTGSTTGIGEAMARRFAAEGARVMIHGLEEDLARSVAGELGGKWHCCDLADARSAAGLVGATVEAFGRIDGLVNNAAAILRGNIETTDAALFDRVMAVNVRGPLLLTKAALGPLRRSKGAVLNVGSVNAYCGEGELLAYSVSKGALTTLTRNLADALGRQGVRVNQINPGWVLTANEDKVQRSLGKAGDWAQRVPADVAPFGRLMRPDEVAAAAVYWVSDESGMVSGSLVDLNQYPMIGRNPGKV